MLDRAKKKRAKGMVHALALLGAGLAIGQPAIARAWTPPIPICSGRGGTAPTLCDRKGSKTFGVGSTGTARGEFVAEGSIFANRCWQSATLGGKIRGCFIGQCANLATAGVQEYSGGGSRAVVQIAGRTVFTQGLSAAGNVTLRPLELKIPLGGTIPIVPGIVDASLEAEFGAGASMGVGYEIAVAPPIARASGNARAYGYGSGSVGVTVLGGVAGSAKCSGTLTLPSPNLTASLDAGVCATNGAALTAVIDPWRMNAKLSWKVGCIPLVGCLYKDSTTLINSSSGTATSYGLL